MKKLTPLLVLIFFAQFLLAQAPPPPPPPPPPKSGQGKDTVATQRPPVVFVYAEQMPAPDYDLNSYLVQNIKYPVEAKKAGAQGVVYIGFIVEKDGSIDSVNVKRSSGNQALDDEAMRVLTSMPKWNPGKMDGRAVRVEITQPVRFTLDATEPDKKKKKQSR